MEVYFSTQAINFLIAVGIGAIISVIYDFFRILRITFRHGTLLTAIEDILFFIAAFCISLAFFMARNNGTVRMYLIVGIFLGFILLHFSLGQVILSIASIIIRCIKAIIRLISKPILMVYKLFCKFFKKVFIFIRKRCIILKKSIFKGFNIKRKRSERTVGKNKKRHKPSHKNHSHRAGGISSVYIHNTSGKNKH